MLASLSCVGASVHLGTIHKAQDERGCRIIDNHAQIKILRRTKLLSKKNKWLKERKAKAKQN